MKLKQTPKREEVWNDTRKNGSEFLTKFSLLVFCQEMVAVENWYH